LPDAACYGKKAWAAEPQQPSLLHKRSCVFLRKLRQSASLLQQDNGLPWNHDTSDRLRRATPTNFATHTITSQPKSCQARNAAPTDTRMTLCASIMSRTCGPWPCGVSGMDVGVSASHNKRVSHLACTSHKRSESRCNPCAFSRLLLPICSRAITKNQHCSVTLALLYRVAY
jgi:hypothetical protein